MSKLDDLLHIMNAGVNVEDPKQRKEMLSTFYNALLENPNLSAKQVANLVANGPTRDETPQQGIDRIAEDLTDDFSKGSKK